MDMKLAGDGIYPSAAVRLSSGAATLLLLPGAGSDTRLISRSRKRSCLSGGAVPWHKGKDEEVQKK